MARFRRCGMRESLLCVYLEAALSVTGISYLTAKHMRNMFYVPSSDKLQERRIHFRFSVDLET